MLLPLKALSNGQLKNLDETVLPRSGHNVSKVEFTDIDGQTKIGFFKPLSSSYPALLAKYAVAISVAIRLSLGDRAAEDRLVFDKNKKIIGTLSINLPSYRPLYTYIQKSPSDPQEAEVVVPSAETLLRTNIAPLLVSAWRFKCDDRHPGNFSLDGLIDWDMCLYPYTYIMKGSRLVDEIKCKLYEKEMKLEFQDLDNFPNIENRTHWPAKSTPGNGNVFKKCQAFASFQELAANKSLTIKNDSVCFQEQLFSALLKELLTYDPEVLRERLKEYLGDELRLNYIGTMEEEKSNQLTQTYPELFNKKTNSLPFIDHMMQVFNREYRELYDTVVYYPGCEKNNSGAAVAEFKTFLRSKPTVYHDILAWMTSENAKRNESAQQQINFKANSLSPKASISQTNLDNLGEVDLLSEEGFQSRGCFDLEKVKKRYHKIWRDTHFPFLANITVHSEILVKRLANALKLHPDLQLSENKSKSLVRSSTELMKWFETSPDLNESENLQCDKNNKLRAVLVAMEKFVVGLRNGIKNYFKIKINDLDFEHNEAFCLNISKIIREADKNIFLPALQGNSWVEQFEEYIKRLEQCTAGLNFKRQLFSRDTPLNQLVQKEYSVSLAQRYTDEDIVEACLHGLFEWVNKLPKTQLKSIVSEAIKDYKPYSLNFTAKRKRAEKISEYVNNTKEDNAHCLATIFSEGGAEENSLNTILLKKLIPIILEDKEINFYVHWLSVRQAVNRKQFNESFYVKKIQKFVLKDQTFTHIFSSIRIAQFEQHLFNWVDNLSPAFFERIIHQGLNTYSENRVGSFFRGGGRKSEVQKYFKKNYSNSEILALIFAGGKKSSSCNKIIFKELVANLKIEISNQLALKTLQNPDVKFILDLNEDHLTYYLNFVKNYSESLVNEMSNPSGGEPFISRADSIFSNLSFQST